VRCAEEKPSASCELLKSACSDVEARDVGGRSDRLRAGSTSPLGIGSEHVHEVCIAIVIPQPHVFFLHESQRKRSQSTRAHDKPPRLVDLLVGDHARRIPHQMPDPIETLVREDPPNREL